MNSDHDANGMNQPRFFENMDRINRAMQKADDIDQMMHDVLDEVLAIFGCDRAYLLYPCNPEAEAWQVPMESSRPEYPGAGKLSEAIPMDAAIAGKMQHLLAHEGVQRFDDEHVDTFPSEVAERFGFKSLIAMALHPRSGDAWEFGLQQCSSARNWTDEEEQLLLEIGRRLSDALSQLLYVRQMRESEEKYRRFVETSSEGVWAQDAGFRTTFVNVRMAEMLGYAEEEIMGHPLSDFMFDEDVTDHEQHMALRRQGISEHYERRFRRSDGSELWTWVSARVIQDDGGHFQGSFAMLTDITQRKRMEQDLVARESDFRTLVENSSDPILRYNRDLQRIYANPVIHRISGKPVESLVGHTPEEKQLLSASEAKKLADAIRRTFDRDQTVHVEFEFVDVHGEMHGYDMLLIPEHDAHGNVKTVLGIARDVTERQLMEQELRLNEERYRKAQAMGRVGNWEYNLQTTHFWGSDEATRIYGFNPAADDFSTDEVERCIPERERVHRTLVDLIEKGKEYNIEFEIHPRDGSEPKTLISIAELQRDEHGDPLKVVGVIQDVTERKKAENELARSEEKFSKAFHASPNLMAITLPENGLIIDINESFCRFFGYSREECVGHSTSELNMWVDPAQRDAFIQKLEKSGEALYVPVELRTKSGEIRSVIDSMTFIDIGDQKYLLSVATDITERKQATAALEKSEKLQRLLLDTLSQQIFYKDRDSRYITCNRTFAEGLGMQPEELVGKSDFEIYPKELAERYRADDLAAMASGKTIDLEEPYEAGGKKFWVHTVKTPMRDANGEVTGILGIFWDITEQRRAAQELERSRASLAEAQHLAKLGNWELDLVTNELAWSDEVYNIFEIDKQEFGASYEAFLNAIHPSDREMVNEAYTESVNNHSSYEIGHRLLMQDGRIKFVQEQGRTDYDQDGKPLRSVGTVQDISHLHEVEEQLHHAQKMEAVGTLVGGIAHDFNNKLAAITGNLFLAQRNIDPDSDTSARLKSVETLSFEAADMVQQLLTFARKGKVEQQPLTLVPFIKEAAKLNRVAIPENIAFSVDYGKDPLPVLGDLTQLQQLFLNLLTNARDALASIDDARIDVSLQRYKPDADFLDRHPEATGTEAFACMQVCDNGHGIAPEHLEKIFDPFFTTKEVGKGTGLGLAMVYGIVQSHHGILEVESTPDVGTCFSIYLPLLRDSRAITAVDDQKKVVKGKNETILLADDDAHVLKAFADVLTSMHYHVLTARNGREAIEVFRQHAEEIDLVILDIVMPEIKGTQAAGQIRKINPAIKLLFATGYDSPREEDAALDDTEILNKPFAMDRVSKIIRRVLDRPIVTGELNDGQ